MQNQSFVRNLIFGSKEEGGFFANVYPLFTVSLLILTRRHFGPQYLSAGRIVAAIVWVPLSIECAFFFWSLSGQDPFFNRFLMKSYILLLTMVGVWRILEIKYKEFNSIRWYSKCRGVSYRFWQKIPVLQDFPYMIQRWVEPLIWVAVAAIMQKIGQWPLAIYFYFSALMFFLEEANNQSAMLREHWNMVDGQIRNDNNTKSTVLRQPLEETEGYWNPMARRLPLDDRARLVAHEQAQLGEYLDFLKATGEGKDLIPQDYDAEQEKQKVYFGPLLNYLGRLFRMKKQEEKNV